MLMRSVGIALVLAASAGVATAQKTIPPTIREVVVPRAGDRITLDGKADETAWRAAPCVGPMVLIGGAGEPERDMTFCRLLHDDAALYLFVTCAARPVEQVTIFQSPNKAWPHGRADRIEIFLNPLPDDMDQYHLDVDRAGGCYETLATKRDTPLKGKNWTGPWQAKVRQTPQGWTAEVRLPFKTFGVRGVKPGDMWRFKIGRHNRRRGDGAIMWPLNPTSGFGTRLADAMLYFDKMNLLRNGDFERGRVVKGAPRPWRASVTRNDRELKGRPQGAVSAIAGGAKPGRRALRVVKTEMNSNLPQVWIHGLRLKSGATYEFSILAKGTLQKPCLRVSARKKGRRARLAKAFTPGAKFKRYAFRFVTPDGAEQVEVGLGVFRNVRGEAVYDNAVLRRVLETEEAAAANANAFAPLTYDPPKDPINGLVAFCERTGNKPWDLFWRDGGLVTQRLIFKDRRFGTELWMLDNSPGRQYNTTATVWQPWNADGSRLRCHGYRPLSKKGEGYWLYNASFSRLRPTPHHAPAVWDLKDPDVFYEFRGRKKELKRVFKNNVRTGRKTLLASWRGPRGHRSHGMTKDGKALFVQDYNGGIWVPYKPEGKPLPVMRILDTSGRLWDEKTRFPSNAFAAVSKHGPLLRIMTGMRVETDTGKTTRVIVPIAGNTGYLKTFASGRVQFPKDAVLPKTRDVEELFKLYHLYPSTTHGHDSFSPDGEYICHDGSPSHWRMRDGKDRHAARISPNGGCYHVNWYVDPRFYTTTVMGYLTRYQRPVHGGWICQVFSDGTWQPVADTKLRTYSFSNYHGSDFATQSLDATKVVYASSMTGAMKLYVAVMQRPQAPRNVTWRAAGRAVELRWTPPPRHREIRGCLVYRSERSGDGYRRITQKPVRGSTWRDASVRPGRAYYYVVTSLESCGLESGYSEEAARAGVGLAGRLTDPLVVYAEAESALIDLKTGEYPGVSRGRDARAASNMYYIYRTPRGRGDPKLKQGRALLNVRAPAAGRYNVWLRVRRQGKDAVAWSVTANGSAVGRAKCPVDAWRWVRAGVAELQAGNCALALETADRGAQADLVCLATDARFTPRGVRPEDNAPPPTVAGLAAKRVRDRTVRLTWRPCAAEDLSHYNVYASRKAFAKPSQEMRIASVTQTALVDWGLRRKAAYHYAVTAVDRRGNESALSRLVAASTADQPPEQRFVLRFDQARIAGEVERKKAKGTRAAQYVIWPYRGKLNGNDVPTIKGSKASWVINVKRPGKYYFWLRFLPRGAPRGDYTPEMQPRIRVLVDGRSIGILGRGETDLAITDKGVRPEWWTWAPPTAGGRLKALELPAGRRTLTLEGFPGEIRYDILLITDEPSFAPSDGRMKLS